jgi:ABC-2 type transport system permease protein
VLALAWNRLLNMDIELNTIRSVPAGRPGILARAWGQREVVRFLVVRDLKVRYKRSALGFLWTLLNPLITIGIFSIVFSRIFAGFYHQYKLYMFSGVMIWNFFSGATLQGLVSLIANGAIIRKIAVAKMVFPIAAVCSNFVNLVLSLVALGIFIPLAGGRFSPALLWLLVALPLLLTFTVGLSLVTASLTVFLRDIRDMWDPLLMVWFFLTPVFYPRSVVPAKYYSLLRFNPMLSILELCRIPIYLGITPPLGLFMKSAVAAVLALALGILVFKRCEDKLIYHI